MVEEESDEDDGPIIDARVKSSVLMLHSADPAKYTQKDSTENPSRMGDMNRMMSNSQ